MPRIPDASALGERTIARGSAPIYQDRSGIIAAEALGDAASKFSQIASAVADENDRFNYSRAKTSLINADLEIRKELENDPDFESYETRYAEKMGKAREGAEKLIRGGRSRALFSDDAQLDFQRGLGEVRGIAKRKETDWGRAELNKSLEANRNSALEAPDESTRAALVNGTNDTIQGAEEKGYISKQEAAELRSKWGTSYAEGFVGMQPAEKQVEMLSNPKGNAAALIAPDRRAAMLDKAQKENRDLVVRRESQLAAASIAASSKGNWNAALKEARKIEDPEIQDATVTRIKQREQEAEASKRQYKEAQSDAAIKYINEGGSFADMPLAIKNALSPGENSALRSYAEGPKKSRQTDPGTLVGLSEMASLDPQRFGEINMLEYLPALSDNDFEKFVDLQRKVMSGSVDGAASGYMSVSKIRNDRLTELFKSASPAKGENEKISRQRDKFVRDFESRMKYERESNGGRPVNSDGARKILDEMTAEVSMGGFFGGSKPVYKLDDKDVKEVPPVLRDRIIKQMQAQGKPLTEDSIQSYFRETLAEMGRKVQLSRQAPPKKSFGPGPPPPPKPAPTVYDAEPASGEGKIIRAPQSYAAAPWTRAGKAERGAQ